MAYISKEDKQKMAPKIKEVLNKYGMKGTISISNHAMLIVKIPKGKLDVMSNFWDKNSNHNEFRKEKPEYLEVYGTGGAEDRFTGSVKDFFGELLSAMRGEDYFDDSDAMTDYFNCSHYYTCYVGNYKKPYQLLTTN